MFLLLRSFAILRLFRAMMAHTPAYMDPGSGSMLLQILLGGLAGVAVMLRLFWYRLKDMFRFGKKGSDEARQADNS